MKESKGSVGSTFEPCASPRSFGGRTFLYAAALVLLGFGLLLSGCGDLSLNMLLENEEPGELRASPGAAAVPTGSVVTIKAQGGFKPYTYEKVSGSGDFEVVGSTGVYKAPNFAEPNVEFQVTDSFGRTDTSKIEVIAPLKLQVNNEEVARITIVDTDPTAAFAVDPVEFDAVGGKVAGKYTYFENGSQIDAADIVGAGHWSFTPSEADTYQIEVFDDLDNSDLVTVTVIDVIAGGELAISPTESQVEQGKTVSFSGINVRGKAVYTATEGSFNGTSPDDTYTAPLSPFTGAVTVTLTDDATGDSVTATVNVVDVDPASLELVLSPSSADLKIGDEMVFSVSGGISPYTFWLRPGSKGKLEKISETGALYTAPLSGNANDQIWVADDVGTPPVSARVRVK